MAHINNLEMAAVINHLALGRFEITQQKKGSMKTSLLICYLFYQQDYTLRSLILAFLPVRARK